MTELHLKFRHKTQPIKISLLLPTTANKLDVDKLTDFWPRAYGFWDGSVWGFVEWDDENKLLLVRWSDEDLSLVDLTPDIELSVGRTFSFHSNRDKIDYELSIASVTARPE